MKQQSCYNGIQGCLCNKNNLYCLGDGKKHPKNSTFPIIQWFHINNIDKIQNNFDVDEETSFYMAEALTAISMGYVRP